MTIILLSGLLAACNPPVAWHGTDVTGVLPDLSFNLLNQRGDPVTEADFAGKTTLVFFGFTSCADVCPATLAQLGLALDALGPVAQQVQVLLVSVDPARDTPQAMADYTARFGPWLHGLTGPEDALSALRSAYYVPAQPELADAQGNYQVMHSGKVFAFDATGRCRLLLPDAADTQAVVADLLRLLEENH